LIPPQKRSPKNAQKSAKNTSSENGSKIKPNEQADRESAWSKIRREEIDRQATDRHTAEAAGDGVSWLGARAFISLAATLAI